MFKIFSILLILVVSPIHSKDILLSFDGSGHIFKWRETIAFAKEHNVKFTYFISAPYYISEAQEKECPYWGLKEFGYIPIKFRNAQLAAHIPSRVRWMNEAIKDGHEIASHLCGHYGVEGSNFTYDQWVQEIEYFHWGLTEAGFDIQHITGVRAPNLAVNKDFYKVLRKMGYKYDSSTVYAPYKPYNFNLVPIRKIEVVGLSKIFYVLPFDYNFNLLHLAPDRNMEEVFFQSLCNDYLTSDLPTQVCLHFKEFKNEPYWNATKRFVEWVKDKDPNYLTYEEARKRSLF